MRNSTTRIVIASLVVFVVMGCTTDADPTAVFCEVAAPLLSDRSPGGGDADVLLVNMKELATKSTSIPGADKLRISAAVDPLVDQLELAVAGRAESGWSSHEVVDVMSDICPDQADDFIAWTVQP